MYIGHYAIGFGAKHPVSYVSLETLLPASQCIDLLYPILVIAGIIEHFSAIPGI